MSLSKRLMVFLISSVVVGAAVFATPSYSAEKWGQCNVQEVMVWPESRLHILCSPAIADKFTFFAVPWRNTEFLNQILSIATAAIAYNKTVYVLYNDTDTTTGPTFSCDAVHCRPIIAISLNR